MRNGLNSIVTKQQLSYFYHQHFVAGVADKLVNSTLVLMVDWQNSFFADNLQTIICGFNCNILVLPILVFENKPEI